MPDTFEALLIVILFIVPGFISQSIFGALVTRREAAEQSALLEAIAFSCLNFALWGWLLLVVPDLDNWKGYVEEHRGLVIASWIIFLLVAPVVWGMLAAFLVKKVGLKWLFKRFALDYRDPTPRAWDYYFGRQQPAWVRVTLTNGTMLGGLLGPHSYASSFPSPEDLYLEVVYPIDQHGVFAPNSTPKSDGVWIQGSQISYLEFIKPL
ncbi:MAG: hypothetical protein QOG89_1938 [Thermomicrobiales bacterium]|nr:hypothetical protein [Thermomicrobiales bacterium]